MVNERQRRQIQKLMRSIKDAKDDGKPKAVIEKRTQRLYNYLEAEGIINQFDE